MDALTGRWSSEASGLYYSSFEDETVEFAPDGSGFFEFCRPGHRSVSPFRWRWSAPDAVELTWQDKPGRLTVGVHIQETDTPFAGRQRVLRIDPAIDFATEFGPCPIQEAPGPG